MQFAATAKREARMASTVLDRWRFGGAGASGRALWKRLGAIALRLNGTQLPIYLDRSDRAELQRTIDG
ncbi:MAG: hypothetical protein DWG79_00625 [Chloroflexi bacterium]|nr:hypothetical protein [Chloroflexota bacterium]MDA1146940.1 hypothetical protein [Chloroflexota bacterium]MQC82363.1 hypothetical protein [Chloroflexota bacterium]MQC82995.1 hypothetical protein [Chloroflexota bacterium]